MGLLETKCGLVGDEEEIISVNEDAVCVERYPSFYSVIIPVNIGRLVVTLFSSLNFGL